MLQIYYLIITPVVSHSLTKEVILGVTNTTHFALGELVRPHNVFSWEERPFAIITPLSSIIDQAVNIFAHDTFIKGTIVLVPEGTDISDLQDKPFRIAYYKKAEESLRIAVDKVIQKNKGLAFRMLADNAALGSKALLDGSININTVSFFENLLKEKQGRLSFGDHTHSQVGDTALLGMIRQMLAELVTINNNILLKIFHEPSAYIDYHLTSIFYNKIKDKYFTQEEQQNIEKMKK